MWEIIKNIVELAASKISAVITDKTRIAYCISVTLDVVYEL